PARRARGGAGHGLMVSHETPFPESWCEQSRFARSSASWIGSLVHARLRVTIRVLPLLRRPEHGGVGAESLGVDVAQLAPVLGVVVAPLLACKCAVERFERLMPAGAI